MVLKLYYERVKESELDRFRDYCEIREFSNMKEFGNERALFLSGKGLGLITPGFPEPLYVKRDQKHLKPFLSNLVRACIPKAKRFSKTYSILDCFSGFGADTMVLALTENKLTSLEKDPLIWLMLREQVFGMENVSTSCQDCIPILEQTASSWDTVYLDPMFHSVRQKSLPSLELQHLRALFSETSQDVGYLIEIAKRVSRERVVVKRKAKDAQLGTPNFSIHGKLVRFDVYRGEAS